MPDDLKIIEIEDRLKQIHAQVRDLLEDIQIIGIHLEEHCTVHNEAVWQSYEELAGDRRELQNSVNSLRDFLAREFKLY